jgi:hypothetical protein
MNIDNVVRTCTPTQRGIITRALNDVDELITRTFNVQENSDVFIKYFGTGWKFVS